MRRAKAKPKRRRPKEVGARGPLSCITLAVVKRVSRRYGLGVPLEDALAAEENHKINLDSWHKALQRHPNLSTRYGGAQGHFIESSLRRLVSDKNLKFLCYVLERRFPHLFRKPDPSVIDIRSSSVLSLPPPEVLQLAAEIARQDQVIAHENTSKTKSSKR